ncbi:hypothetical protein MICRO11B_520007 [Micrococcus luteus]|nr:hypothetical protein MICRO11B_520007 [Micrococcus luteus]
MEPVERRRQVRGRGDVQPGAAQREALQVVLRVVAHHGHRAEVDDVARRVPGAQGGRGERDVAHAPQRLRRTPLHRLRLRGDGGQHLAPAQQPGAVVLVLDVQVQDRVVPVGGLGQDGPEPRAQHVGGHGQGGDAAPGRRAAQPGPRLLFEHPHVPGHAHQADAGLSRLAGCAAPEQHLAHLPLQGADALADRRGADAELVRGRLERALVRDRTQRLQLIKVHEAELRHLQFSSFGSGPAGP